MTDTYAYVFQFINGAYRFVVSNWITAIPVGIFLIYLARYVFNYLKKMLKGG